MTDPKPRVSIHRIGLLAGLVLVLAAAGCGGKSAKDEAAKARNQDAAAKVAARNLAMEVESCYTDFQDYSRCGVAKLTKNGVKLAFGDGPGQVTVGEMEIGSYKVTAHSESGNTFSIQRSNDGAMKLTCDGSGTDKGGCRNGAW